MILKQMKVFYLIIDLALLNVGFVWNALFVPHSIGILST